MRAGLGAGLLVVVHSAVGCGGHASDLRSAGGASANAGAPSDAAGGASGAVGGAAGLPGSPDETAIPSKTGDGRVADPADPENQGFGWDTCRGTPWVRTGPVEGCSACPAASLGDRYLLFNFEPAISPPGTPLTGYESSSQVAFFFEPAEAAAGLWFDVAWVSGKKEGSVLSMWHGDSACQNTSGARTVPLERLLGDVAGKWVTGCVPFATEGQVEGFNLRIDTDAVVALDAVRFGPACPHSP